MEVQLSKNILSIPKYSNEAIALGLDPRDSVMDKAIWVKHRLELGMLREPLYIDGVGLGGALVDILKADGVEVIEFKVRRI